MPHTKKRSPGSGLNNSTSSGAKLSSSRGFPGSPGGSGRGEAAGGGGGSAVPTLALQDQEKKTQKLDVGDFENTLVNAAGRIWDEIMKGANNNLHIDVSKETGEKANAETLKSLKKQVETAAKR